ncbi:MAG: TetR/AcrR family transcriptional regulator [bacterium]|nr:TetR/AcrR family transcriptional regulator [bacterium]
MKEKINSGKKDSVSKEKIILAAIEIFAQKGKHGASMEEIAEKAGVNKALLYYYFKGKDNLFQKTLTEVLHKIFYRIISNIEQTNSDMGNSIKKEECFWDAHRDAFSQDSNFSKIILGVISDEPCSLRDAIESIKKEGEHKISSELLTIFEKGMLKEKFQRINSAHVLSSIFERGKGIPQ